MFRTCPRYQSTLDCKIYHRINADLWQQENLSFKLTHDSTKWSTNRSQNTIATPTSQLPRSTRKIQKMKWTQLMTTHKMRQYKHKHAYSAFPTITAKVALLPSNKNYHYLQLVVSLHRHYPPKSNIHIEKVVIYQMQTTRNKQEAILLTAANSTLKEYRPKHVATTTCDRTAIVIMHSNNMSTVRLGTPTYQPVTLQLIAKLTFIRGYI
jgi:hypothetical protein